MKNPELRGVCVCIEENSGLGAGGGFPKAPLKHFLCISASAMNTAYVIFLTQVVFQKNVSLVRSGVAHRKPLQFRL